VSRLLRSFVIEARFQVAKTIVRPTFIFTLFIEPLIFATVAYFLWRGAEPQAFMNYVIFGAGMVGMWGAVLFSSGADIVRERENGTLEYLVASPTPLYHITLGKTLTNSILGLTPFLLVTVYVRLVFGREVAIHHPLAFGVSLVLLVLALNSLGMLIASGFALSRQARAFQNLMGYPVYVLSGLLFPVDQLPLVLKPLSWALATTWGAELLRVAAAPTLDKVRFAQVAALLVGISGVYFLTIARLFRAIEVRARIHATLGVD